MLPAEKQIFLTGLKKDCFSCRECEIGKTVIPEKDLNLRPQVFSRGNVNARIVLVGQNPGKTEILESKPFVGDAGKFLDKMIQILGLEKKDFYVTNTVKCFTPGNRTPSDQEIQSCRKFLIQELLTIQPDLIITLGNPAMKTILGYTGITKPENHGQLKRSTEFNCDVFPLLHPASTLHNRNLYLPMMEKDLDKLKSIVNNYK